MSGNVYKVKFYRETRVYERSCNVYAPDVAAALATFNQDEPTSIVIAVEKIVTVDLVWSPTTDA